MTVRVEEFTGAAGEWNAFVRTQPGWTHYHLYDWRTVIGTVHGHACPYLAARDDSGALCGVLPLVRVKSRVFGHFLVSMPFVNYGGPLGTGEAIGALVDRACALAREGGVKLLELRNRYPLPVSLEVSHRKITVVLDIPPGDPEAIWNAIGSKRRNQIRRITKLGATVRFGPEVVDDFFDVFAVHMRELGTPTQPRRLFRTLAATFPEDCWFGCVYLEGRPVACGCGFVWNGECEVSWASSLNEHKALQPNTLLHWSFMERSAAAGLSRFNFGRSTPGSSQHSFKQGWKGRDEQLWWYELGPRPGAKTPSPDDAAYAWGPKLWRKLPTPIATALGPHIMRFIP